MSANISDIFKKYSVEYLRKYGKNIPVSHIRAIQDIVNCRTQSMGGKTYYCKKCRKYHYSYHSCKNRNCPKCQNEDSKVWLEKQMKKLLPVNYHFVTFTLPAEFRAIARSNQKLVYSILFKAASDSLKLLSGDPKFIGGQIGMVGVLHTWTRTLCYHPHIHFIVSGGGYDSERDEWRNASGKYLFPVKALSKIFRAKFRDALYHTELYKKVCRTVWEKRLVVHSKPVGKGEAALKYLSKYIYRIAISNKRIIEESNHKVKFYYKDSNSGEEKEMELDVLEFMRRYLQHVLPLRFQKVRYYGFLSSASKKKFGKIKLLLNVRSTSVEATIEKKDDESGAIKCPKCKNIMIFVKNNIRSKRAPPKVWMKDFLYEHNDKKS